MKYNLALKKFGFLHKYLAVVISLLCISCSSGGSDSEENTLPTNLIVNSVVVGANASNPNGDGSGVVNFTVSADNATSYKILIGTDVINTTTGVFSHTFTQSRTNSYTIYVSAYNGAQFISTSVVITVFVTTTLAWSDEFNTDGPPDS